MIPYNHPQNRFEAQANAVHYAKEEEFNLAQTWAAIAMTFPEVIASSTPGDTMMISDLSRSADETVIMRRPPVEYLEEQHIIYRNGLLHEFSVTINSRSLDVLRALAARYVLSSMNREAHVDLVRDDDSLNPVLHRIPNSDQFRVTVEP